MLESKEQLGAHLQSANEDARVGSPPSLTQKNNNVGTVKSSCSIISEPHRMMGNTWGAALRLFLLYGTDVVPWNTELTAVLFVALKA